MRTTVEISDALLSEARRAAERRGTTLRALIEDGLRRVLEEQRQTSVFQLRRATFRGRGLHPELGEATWEAIRKRAYEGRGG